MQKPEFFAWHVKEPMRYSLVIKDDLLWQWDEDSKAVQRVAVSKNPVFKTVTEHMSKWFSGAYTSLRVEYEINILEQNPVSLQFIPRKTTVDNDVIKSVNGQDIRSTGDLMKLYNTLKDTHFFSVNIVRNNQTKTLNFKVR